MSIFSKVLVQSEENTYHLEEKQITVTSDKFKLEGVIPEFFKIKTSGIHTAIICTDNPLDVISESEFQKQLNVVSPNDVIKCLTGSNDTLKLSSEEYCGCARPTDGLSTQIGGALQYIENCVGKFLGKEMIDCFAHMEISRYMRKEKDEVHIGEIWTKWEAKVCSNLLPQESIQQLGFTPSIFVLYVLPESCFETFNHKDACFPLFIEYVVLGEDPETYHNNRQKEDQAVIDANKYSLTTSDERHKISESQEIFIQSETEKFQLLLLEAEKFQLLLLEAEKFQPLLLEADKYKLLQNMREMISLLKKLLEKHQFKDSTKHIHER